jgi:hypothetical protein
MKMALKSSMRNVLKFKITVISEISSLTSEALPRLDNYRISKRALKRPSLGELHGEPQQKVVSAST